MDSAYSLMFINHFYFIFSSKNCLTYGQFSVSGLTSGPIFGTIAVVLLTPISSTKPDSRGRRYWSMLASHSLRWVWKTCCWNSRRWLWCLQMWSCCVICSCYSKDSNATDWSIEKCIKPVKLIENQSLEDNFGGSLIEFGRFIHKSIVDCSQCPCKDTQAFCPGDFILHKTAYYFSPLSQHFF